MNSWQTDTSEAFGTADDVMTGDVEEVGDGKTKGSGDRVYPKSNTRAASSDMNPPDVIETAKTVAEKLEAVKAVEAKLLKEFKETHERCAKVSRLMIRRVIPFCFPSCVCFCEWIVILLKGNSLSCWFI